MPVTVSVSRSSLAVWPSHVMQLLLKGDAMQKLTSSSSYVGWEARPGRLSQQQHVGLAYEKPRQL